MRTLIERDPFLHLNKGKPWREQGLWHCFWIHCPNVGDPPFVTAYRLLQRMDAFLARLSLWFDLVDGGLKTPVESPEPSRSDCHGWGAHPLFHYFATLLGIRPASFGFRTVEVRPQLGSLAHASGTMVHPLGEIVVDLHVKEGVLRGRVSLPADVVGTLYVNGQSHTFRGSLTI